MFASILSRWATTILLIGLAAPSFNSLAQQGRPIRIVVAFAPGGSNDVLARLIAPNLSERLGRSIIVENRPGAGGNIGSDHVARSAPDGNTLLLASPGLAVNITLYSKNTFDARKDLVPVSLIGISPNVLVVHPSVPATTIAEFITFAKASQSGITYGSSGSGGAMHLSAELFKMLTGANLLHVPYKGGGPAVADLVGGQIQSIFANVVTALPHIKSGGVKALGVTSKKRDEALADVPTIIEAGVPDYEAYVWWAMFAAGGTSPNVAAGLQRELAIVLKAPDVANWARTQAIEFIGSTPETLERFFNTEIEKWGAVVKQAGLKID